MVVDASRLGLGTVLAQKECKEEKGGNIVAFVSRTLTDVETKDVARQSEKHFRRYYFATWGSKVISTENQINNWDCSKRLVADFFKPTYIMHFVMHLVNLSYDISIRGSVYSSSLYSFRIICVTLLYFALFFSRN